MNDVEITTRICSLLGRVPTWEWRPTGPAYTATETAIFYGPIGATPDRAIGVRLYGADDNDIQHERTRRAQVRYRGRKGSPADADAMASIGFDVLQGLSRVGGISGIRRISMVPLGADENGRDERTDNYLIILDNPEASA